MLGSLVALLPITATLLLSIIALLLPRLSWHHAGSPPHIADERIVFDPASIMSIIRASAAGGVPDFFQGLHHAPESAKDKDHHFFFIGLTDDNKIGFVEPEAPGFGIPYPHTGRKQHI